MSPVGKRHRVIVACILAAAVLVVLCIDTLLPTMPQVDSNQLTARENAHSDQLRTLRNDMRPILDEFDDILSGKRTQADGRNAALSTYDQIGKQSSAEHFAGSYLHIDSYVEDCDLAENGGVVYVIYECAAITEDSEKVIIADRTRATWDIEKQDGSWAVVSVRDNNLVTAPNERQQ